MPADRLVHPRCGKSAKVSLLTDLEFRVWVQYLLAADDFGVMHATAVELQSRNLHLANRPAKMLLRCLDALVKVGLVHRFEHQKQPYIYQRDWQKWQKVEYPRGTDNPAPTGADLAACAESTRELFEKHPGGQRKVTKAKDAPNDSGHTSQIDSENVPPTRAGAPAERLTANGSGHRPSAQTHGSPLIPRRRLDAAYEFERVYVPQRKHADLLAAHGNERELEAFYERIAEEWSSSGPYAKANPGDMFKFWQARYDEWKPVPAAAKPSSHKPAWLRGA